MSRGGWWGATLTSAAVGAGLAGLLRLAGPPTPGEDLGAYWMVMVAIAAPAALAAGLLWRAWWVRSGAQMSTMDAPARLLAIAVATLPSDRRDWGVAMAVELAHVSDRRARWWFAAGCARTALFPPRGHRVPALAVAVLAAAAVAGTGLVVGQALPEMRVFAVTFMWLLGALATVVVARAGRVHRPAQGLLVPVIGLAGVIAGIAVVGFYLATDAAVVLDRSAAAFLAVVLAGGLWLSLAPPRRLATSRLARRVGLGLGLAVAAGLFATAQLGRTEDGEGVLLLYLLGVPMVAVFMTAALVALADRSLWAGLQATVWAVVFTGLLSFTVFVVEAARYARSSGVSIVDGDPDPIGENLILHGGIVWVLGFELLWALPLGVIGALLGAIGSSQRGGVAPTVR